MIGSHPESTKHSVFHHSEELLMAQTVVPVQVKDFKNCVQNILWKVVTCRYLHCSLKLGYGAKNKGGCYAFKLLNQYYIDL